MVDITLLVETLKSPEVSSFILTYVATTSLDALLSLAKKTYTKKSVEYQLVDALNIALHQTCDEFGIEENYDAISEAFIVSLKDIISDIDEDNLCKVFTKAIGAEEMLVEREILEYWITRFDLAISNPSRSWLYNYIQQQYHRINVLNGTQRVLLKDNKQEFIKQWNERLFLHKNDEKYELRLCDLYIPLRYNKNGSEGEIVFQEVNDFIFTEKNKMMIIVGNPGIGKSSLMCSLAKQFESDTSFVFIRLFRLEPRLASSSILDAVKDYLNCNNKELANKILVLDGYDELRVDNKHYDLCVKLISEIKSIDGLKVIISSRLNYIDFNKTEFENDFGETVSIELLPFNKEQILAYVYKYYAKFEIEISQKDNKFTQNETITEVFGIPFILYLICSLNLDIASIKNITDVYNKVFSPKGGIFEKIYDNNAHYLLDNPRIKSELIEISKLIASQMFKKNELVISLTGELETILEKYPDRHDDFGIGNYYKIENGILMFVHKTFYEYFFSLCVIDLVRKLLNTTDEETLFHLEDIFYCSNYLHKRLEIMIQSLYLNEAYENTDNIVNSLNYVIQRLFYVKVNADIKGSYRKTQNLISSVLKLYKIILGETWMNYLDAQSMDVLSLIIRVKNYVHVALNGAIVNDNDLSGSFLRAGISKCLFRDTNMCRCDFYKTKISNSEFDKCSAFSLYGDGVTFNNTKISNTVFNNSSLKKSRFIICELVKCSFNNVDLRSSRFENCALTCIIFDRADLSYSDFRGTALCDVDFTNALLEKSIYDMKNVAILKTLSKTQTHNATVEIMPQKVNKYFSIGERIKYKTYCNSFKSYNEYNQFFLEGFSPLISLYLIEETCDADENMLFSGMKCRLTGIKWLDHQAQIEIDYYRTIEANQKYLTRIKNNSKYTKLLRYWSHIKPEDNTKVSFTYYTNGNPDEIINCIRIIGKKAREFINSD